MKRLLKGGSVVNVFTDTVEKANVLMEDGVILGVGDYTEKEADTVEDVTGKYICPGFIDGHIHIESTMLIPPEFARVSIPHGTTTVVADPHEIANVSGTLGIEFMLEASENIPLTVYIMLPSCVPSTPFDEAGAILEAEDLHPLYRHPRVLGLGEVMNYLGVMAKDAPLLAKIEDAKRLHKIINGHAPLQSGKHLDAYLSAGINDDHECSTAEEGKERIRKGQWLMIREGTAARNLKGLLPLFEEPWSRRCLLVTDDRHPADLAAHGHIDDIIRKAVEAGKSVMTAIRMATIQAAECFGLKYVGAVAPGYVADLLVLDDLEKVSVRDVYRHGETVVRDHRLIPFSDPDVRQDCQKAVRNSFYLDPPEVENFHIEPKGSRCRVIQVIPGELITKEWVTEIDFSQRNGIDLDRDILKLAVVERHLNTGHIGLGFINGIGMKEGAIASSVSHDSHNLIVIGANEKDMAVAADRIRELGGGLIVVKNGEILAEMPLPIGGLMTDVDAATTAAENEAVREAVHRLGVPRTFEPFMTMAFVSLPVIPNLKMSTKGLVDVNKQELLPLFV